MKTARIEEIEKELAFAKRAAEHFARNPLNYSYSSDEIAPGVFLALRWGMGDDCVLVMKLDESHAPTNYENLVRDAIGPFDD